MKKIFSFIFVVLITFFMLGCEKSKGETVIKYVGLKVYDPVYVALEKGFFEAEGVEVELVDTVAGGMSAVEMVSSGSANGGLLSLMAIINAKNAGLPVIGVLDIQSAFEGYPLEEFYVRKDSGIKSIKDLKGKNIAINLFKSSFHYTWEIELAKNGMSANDVNFVQIAFAQQEEALKNGIVDAIGLMQPYSKSVRENDEFVKLYDAVDCFGERQFCTIFLNEEWADKNPEQATKFVTALAKTCKWIEKNQEEAREIIAKYTGVDKNKIDDYKYQQNAMCNMEDVQYWIDFMVNFEGVSSDLKPEQIATNKYNKLC